MRIRDSKGFSAVELLFIIIIVAGIGFTGWYVWHSKQAADSTLDKSANANAVPASKKYILTFDSANLPKDWKLDNSASDVLTLAKTDNSCFAEVASVNDSRENFASYDSELQATIDGAKNKGYTAEILGKDTVQLTTATSSSNGPTKELSATLMKISGNDTVQYTEDAFSSTKVPKAEVHLSCGAQADLASAKSAVAAITVEGL